MRRVLIHLLVALPAAFALGPSAMAAVPIASAARQADDARIAELVKRLEKDLDRTPRAVFEELGKARTPAAYLALKNALRSLKRPTAQRFVYSAFRHMAGDPELGPKALALVEKAARSRDAAEARAAAGALGYYGPDGHAAMIEVARHAPDAIARASALRGVLGQLSKEPTRKNLEVILGALMVPQSGDRKAAVEVLRRFRSKDAFAAFTKAVSAKDAQLTTVRLILAAMGSHPIGGPAEVDEGADRVLSKAAAGRDPILQYYALLAMARRGGTPNTRLVEKLAKAKDPTVRRAALLVAFRANARGADPVALSGGRDPIGRQAAAIALAERSDDASLDALHTLLADEDMLVRSEAARQIAARGDLRSMDALIARLGVEEGRMRGDLRSALEALTGRSYGLNARVWAKFWAAEGDGFVPPTDEERKKLEEERAAKEEKAESRVAFYGIDIVSNRFALVIDTSGSMQQKAYTGDTRLHVAKKQLKSTLERLRDGVLFNVVPFASSVEEMESTMIELSDDSRAEALEFARELQAGGGTNIHDALEVAFEDDRVDTIYLLSDGAPSAGPIVDPTALRAEVARWNSVRGIVIHCVAVGQDHVLLRGLAEDSGGVYVRVN